MKKRTLLLLLALLMLLTGCRRNEPVEEKPQPEQPPENPPVEEVVNQCLQIDELRIELTRGASSTGALAEAVKILPGLLETYFSDAEDLEIGQITVTVGASPAATAQTLAAGNINLAFLPAEDYLLYGTGSNVLYADADLNGDVVHAGVRALLCSAPTEYGFQLAQRAGGGKPLSWNEVSRARWGVLSEESLASYRAFDLWLSDNYEGARVEDLPKVTVYQSETELFQAAAAGEIDALSVRDDARAELEEFWMHPAGEDAEGGGFGREERIWDEIAVLDVTERLYAVVIAAAPEEALEDSRFTKAFAGALDRLMQEEPELLQVLGADGFAPAAREQLDAMARLAALEG